MLDDNEIFSDLMMGNCHEAANVANIVACINMKFASCCDDESKREVLTEVLNEIKLLLAPAGTVH